MSSPMPRRAQGFVVKRTVDQEGTVAFLLSLSCQVSDRSSSASVFDYSWKCVLRHMVRSMRYSSTQGKLGVNHAICLVTNRIAGAGG